VDDASIMNEVKTLEQRRKSAWLQRLVSPPTVRGLTLRLSQGPIRDKSEKSLGRTLLKSAIISTPSLHSAGEKRVHTPRGSEPSSQTHTTPSGCTVPHFVPSCRCTPGHSGVGCLIQTPPNVYSTDVGESRPPRAVEVFKKLS
jgi:hypothetical protein